MALPIKGATYSFQISLIDAGSPTNFKDSPTLEAADFAISQDGGTYAALNTTPTVATATDLIDVDLSTLETNCEQITIKIEDSSGGEWLPMKILIQTV